MSKRPVFERFTPQLEELLADPVLTALLCSPSAVLKQLKVWSRAGERSGVGRACARTLIQFLLRPSHRRLANKKIRYDLRNALASKLVKEVSRRFPGGPRVNGMEWRIIKDTCGPALDALLLILSGPTEDCPYCTTHPCGKCVPGMTAPCAIHCACAKQTKKPRRLKDGGKRRMA